MVDLSLFNSIFYSFQVLKIQGLIGIIVSLGTCLIITREFDKIKFLMLPISLTWTVMGMYIPKLFLVFSGILFVLSALTMTNVVDLLTVNKKLPENAKVYHKLSSINKIPINTKKKLFDLITKYRK